VNATAQAGVGGGAGGGAAALVVGDFNCTPHSPLHRFLTGG
jgi:endonuclease/exonuclease/phosphatase family metal-dependent hydrolase